VSRTRSHSVTQDSLTTCCFMIHTGPLQRFQLTSSVFSATPQYYPNFKLDQLTPQPHLSHFRSAPTIFSCLFLSSVLVIVPYSHARSIESSWSYLTRLWQSYMQPPAPQFHRTTSATAMSNASLPSLLPVPYLYWHSINRLQHCIALEQA
jgi:hypothetical protein